jgi:hypothetical protein
MVSHDEYMHNLFSILNMSFLNQVLYIKMSIPNRIGDAILQDNVPGEFDADRKCFQFPLLQSNSSTGAKLFWTIKVALLDCTGNGRYLSITPERVSDLSPGMAGEISSSSWQDGGTPRGGTKPTLVMRGKNVGKINATNAITQAFREAWSKYNDRIRKGFTNVTDVGEELLPPNPPPMLVQKYGATQTSTLSPTDFKNGVFVQRKFNGVRAVARLNDEATDVVIYSRSGVEYRGLDRLRSELYQILSLAPALPEDSDNMPYIDGELYKHGESLQKISGQARNSVDEGDLCFFVFDCFFPDANTYTFGERFKYISKLLTTSQQRLYVRLVETLKVENLETIQMLSNMWVKGGYEGAIARRSSGTYQYGNNGYHSPHVIKFKPIYDSEFAVVNYTEGVGRDKGAVVWVCEVGLAESVDVNDRLFHVVPKGVSLEERYQIYSCLSQIVVDGVGQQMTRFVRDFYGQPLTVEYPERSTKTGKPVQSKALAFRTYEIVSGIQDNALQRLFRECA